MYTQQSLPHIKDHITRVLSSNDKICLLAPRFNTEPTSLTIMSRRLSTPPSYQGPHHSCLSSNDIICLLAPRFSTEPTSLSTMSIRYSIQVTKTKFSHPKIKLRLDTYMELDHLFICHTFLFSRCGT